MIRRIFISGILLLIPVFSNGCPLINPQPTPKPATPIPSESLPVIPISPPIIQSSIPIVESVYKVEFGPGSKGVSYFGPSSKGVTGFGPGSKGINEFGPSSKGVTGFGPGSKGITNLRFNINIPDSLVRTEISSFSTKALENESVKVDNLVVTLEKSGKLIAETTILPKTANIVFRLDLLTDNDDLTSDYKIKAVVKNNFKNLQENTLVTLDNNTEVKITLYSQSNKPEDLDIAIRTAPILP